MSPTKLLDVHGADSIAITVINRQPLCRLDLVRRDSVPAIMPPATAPALAVSQSPRRFTGIWPDR